MLCGMDPTCAFAEDIIWRPPQLEIEKLEGLWLIEEAVSSGRLLPYEERLRLPLRFKMGAYTLGNDSGTYVANTDSLPYRIDFNCTAGENTGRFFPAIWLIDRDTYLDICIDLSGKSYPAVFESRKGSHYLLLKYKR